MEKQFNLSEMINYHGGMVNKPLDSISVNDVKEFVRLLKEDTGCEPINSREKQIIALFKERINKLSGDKLNKKED